jgi:hypothetical protein
MIAKPTVATNVKSLFSVTDCALAGVGNGAVSTVLTPQQREVHLIALLSLASAFAWF